MGVEFPPMLTGLAVADAPFETACASVQEVEPGMVFYTPKNDVLQAALVLAPETALAEAVSVSFAVALGINDAVGALAPPEVGLHLEWPFGFRVNGARCGALRVAASTSTPEVEPDWLVVGVEMPVRDASHREPGLDVDRTTLEAEGCGDMTAPVLLESWAKHTMNWLHIYLTEGFHPLHAHWTSRAHLFGEQIEEPVSGQFVGLDEQGGLILKDASGTRILPLTDYMEPA